jgi:UDP-N-acetyl-D-mannosaminuronate dehydrogenase
VAIGYLRDMGAEVRVHDPYVKDFQGDLLEMARGCDAALVMVKHDEYVRLDLKSLRVALNSPILVDGRAVYDPKSAEQAGLVYRLVGRIQEPAI